MEPDQNLLAYGWVSLDQDYELQINSNPISISAIRQLADIGLSGQITLAAKGAGKITNPQVDGQILISGLASGQKLLPDMKIDLAFKDQALCIDTEYPFAMHVTYNLPEKDFSATAGMVETELAPFFQIAGRRDFSGQVTGMLEASGNTQNVDQKQK